MAVLGLFGTVALAVATVCVTAGCSTLGYYAQSVGGHLDLLGSAKPVPNWIAEGQTPAALKERLALSQRIRDFAVAELKLPDNASYRRYADLNRRAAVWNVVAAPELSLTLKTWCFPVVGCVGYRGYFDLAEAEAFADGQRAQTGLEVSVYAVPAYSTLGALPGRFFADPLLSTFIHYPEGELARLVFHELSHQVVYAKGDTEFNESFATAVERIGVMRWLNERATPETRAEYDLFEDRRREFRTLTRKYRERLEALYESDASDDDKRREKAETMAEMRAEYAAIKATRWGGFSGYDAWFARANNASFGVLAAYTELAPAFERLFEREGRDFDRFYAAVKRLAEMPKNERRAALGPTGD
ncbi:aminopeptidase [Piscinibacter sp.]|uniref:aminopeptidase n=1 Tax=Piscinibacter sp. TaxID=1903157 RepID=UPI002D19E5FB|nr:aminopeptidase [Albitalea sp.]HUG23233.1 aminopeptidase [Albitalea sp.]